MSDVHAPPARPTLLAAFILALFLSTVFLTGLAAIRSIWGL
ncbi:MAG: hypothetical protein AAFN80_13555 [Pseudomonadota bacterium]